MTLEFDPNTKLKPVMPEWATYAPNRRPQWKVHKRKSDAKNAFFHHTDIILYQFRGIKWVEQYRKEGQDDNCHDCGAEVWREHTYHIGGKDHVYRTYSGRRMWDKTEDLKMITVCSTCAHKRWSSDT